MGGSILVFGSPQQRNLLPGVTHDQAMVYAAEVFQAAMPVLEDLDVTLAVEPLGPAEGDFLRTADLGARLVEMVGSTQCRLHLDCKAMSSEATPIPEIIRRHAAMLVHFHANDANRLGPGFGEIDFDAHLRGPLATRLIIAAGCQSRCSTIRQESSGCRAREHRLHARMSRTTRRAIVGRERGGALPEHPSPLRGEVG